MLTQPERRAIRLQGGRGYWRRLALSSFALAAVALLALIGVAEAEDAIVGRASIIDGDTIEIHGKRIRLHGIDAPEGAQWCVRDGEPWRCGQDAALALADRIDTRPVSCKPLDTDRYRRTVARCFEGGRDLQAWLVRNGWALAYRRYSLDYVADEWAARITGRGMWAGDFVAPWEWRRPKHGN